MNPDLVLQTLTPCREVPVTDVIPMACVKAGRRLAQNTERLVRHIPYPSGDRRDRGWTARLDAAFPERPSCR